MHHAPCPVPCALCPVPHAHVLCPVHHATLHHAITRALCAVPHAHVPCPVHHARCPVIHALDDGSMCHMRLSRFAGIHALQVFVSSCAQEKEGAVTRLQARLRGNRARHETTGLSTEASVPCYVMFGNAT